jgi:hypothetical protein
MDQEPGGLIALPAGQFETLLDRAAETGARRALHEVGLDGTDAAEDIRDLRSLLVALASRNRRRCRPRCGCSPPASCSR